MNNADNLILKDIYGDYFKIGAACEKRSERFKNNEIGNPDKEALILEQFSSITCANELKPAYNMGYNSEDAKEDYLPFVINPFAKNMLDWAKEHGMKMRGHVLVWHSQCPKEAFCKGYKPVTIPTDPEKLKEHPEMKRFEKLDPSCYVDRDTMLKRLKSYIYSLMEYMYKNGYMQTLYAWDVVNEAIELADKTETGLRNTYWYQVIGDDFMYWAFKYAHDAVDEMAAKYADVYSLKPDDTDTIKPKLFYNDYNEFQPPKQDAIIAALKREGCGHGSILGEDLIDGIGMQGHLSDNNNIEEYKKALLKYGELVREIHITELDVKCTARGVNREYYQAVFYKAFFEMLLEAKKNGTNITSVTFWGLTDDNTWIRGADPLLFKGDLSKKRSFDALCYAVSGESLGDPSPVKIDLSDRLYDFESDMPAEELGFTMKGFGDFVIQEEVTHSGKKAIYNEHRFGDWCGVAFDVTDFIGQTIDVSAWVKSKADEVILKADDNDTRPVIGSIDTKSGEWVHLTGRYKVPNDVYSMQLLFVSKDSDGLSMSPIYIDDVEVKLVGLSENFEEKTNIAGIRGAGHLPVLTVTDEVCRGGGGHSLLVRRQEKDATVKFDISSYIGMKIKFTAFVKTGDKSVKAGLDGAPSKELANVAAGGDWTEVSFETDLPKDLKAAEVYIETDGNADYYVDDIFVAPVR